MQVPCTPTLSPDRISAALADFIYHMDWEGIPRPVRHEIKRAILNYFAVSIAGSADPTIDIVTAVYSQYSAGPAARLIGRTERVDVPTAAAINAMSANVYDFDDTHVPTVIHPTAPVAAALFALSETVPLSGQDFMLAFALGVQAECRIGLAMSPFHYSKGWHITSTCGVFGSAMAVGKILGLTTDQLVWALGGAACQAGGLVENLGTMSKSLSVGNTARNGLLAARLAGDGFGGPALPLEGSHGFLRVFGQEPDFSVFMRSLASEWEVERIAYKPYPCGVVLNPVIDACLILSERAGKGRLPALESIVLTGHPLLRQRTDRLSVKTGRQSQVSARHAVAVALMRRRATLADFSDDAVADPKLRAIGALLQFEDDPSYSIESARVSLHFADDGEPLEEFVPVARGALENPLTDADLEQKLRDLCAYTGAAIDSERLIAAIWALDRAKDVSVLMGLAAAMPPGR